MPPPAVRLGEVLVLDRRAVDVDPDAEYRMLGIYSHGRGTFRKESILGADAPQVGLYEVRAGDFVLNITFAWERAVAIVGANDDGWYVSGRFPTFRADPERLDARYLLYHFSTRQGLDQLVAVSPGSAGRNRVLSIRRFLDLEIALPAIDAQRAAANRIQAIARRAESAHRDHLAGGTEAAALAIAQARDIAAASASVTRPLGELVTVRGGGTPSKANPEYWEGEIPWISPKDMKTREIDDSIDHISDAAIVESSAKLLDPGCVLVVTRGMILAHTVPVARLRVPAAINQDMKALTPGEGVSAEYLCAVLWALNGRLVDLVERSTHDTRKLQTATLLAFNIPVPSREDQDKLVERLARVHARHEAIRDLRDEVRLSLEALVPAIVNHELGLATAERSRQAAEAA